MTSLVSDLLSDMELVLRLRQVHKYQVRIAWMVEGVLFLAPKDDDSIGLFGDCIRVSDVDQLGDSRTDALCWTSMISLDPIFGRARFEETLERQMDAESMYRVLRRERQAIAERLWTPRDANQPCEQG